MSSRICVLDGLVVKTVGTAVLIDVKFVVLVFRLLLVILSSLDSLWFTIMGGIWTLFPLFEDRGMLSPERKLVIKTITLNQGLMEVFLRFLPRTLS